jgi:hypothetical protein
MNILKHQSILGGCMAKIVTKETNVVEGAPGRREAAQITSTHEKAETPDTLVYIAYFVSGAIEILLLFRFFFRLIGANPASGFVRFLYSVTQILIMPFEGIFRRQATQGLEVSAIFEPATLVAMVVYAVLTWGVMHLIAIASGQTPQE